MSKEKEERPSTEEEISKNLGFVDVDAYRLYKLWSDDVENDPIDLLLMEVANLRIKVRNIVLERGAS